MSRSDGCGRPLICTSLVLLALSTAAGCSREVPRREDALKSWHEIRLGMSRREFAEFLQRSKIEWNSVQMPGTGPSTWANHVDVVLLDKDGNRIGRSRQFAVEFADGQRWDYGGLPRGEEVVDPARLVGSLDPDSPVVGVRWMVHRTDREKENHTIPWEVLSVLGAPHRDEADLTGYGRNYFWKWPDVEAIYQSASGELTISSTQGRKAAVPPRRDSSAGPPMIQSPTETNPTQELPQAGEDAREGEPADQKLKDADASLRRSPAPGPVEQQSFSGSWPLPRNVKWFNCCVGGLSRRALLLWRRCGSGKTSARR